MSGIVLSSRVRLARNYTDLPFRAHISREQSEECVNRTLSALRDLPESYTYLPLRSADETEKKTLVESHLISPDLLTNLENAAVLIRGDKKISVMMNEEDHLRIQAFSPGENLNEAAENAFSIDDELQRRLSFAFDGQLGYLTACPTNTGTGMRASMMLHLPMLTLLKQMGKVNQLAAKLGLTIRGIYGEGSEAQGNLYQLSNQVTLGRTEKEIVEAVTALARQVAEMERVFRQKTRDKDATAFEDPLYRSFGLLSHARRMPLKEFMVHWSNLRLGAAMGVLPLSPAACDQLLTAAQPGHVQKKAGKILIPKEQDEQRAIIIRSALNGGN
ncbi:MAG: ATP--guanido phosphotransferase [Clostridiales bacterium]|nr:ATP--guanido phosphotransferase [Clostridiales bacterium]